MTNKHLKADDFEAVTRFANMIEDPEPRYGRLEIPPYVETAAGRWTLTRDPKSRVIRGYLTGLQSVDSNWILHRRQRGKATVWMSVTPMELESLAIQHRYAEGTVVIMGLGIGLLLWNVSRKPEVKQIIVVEQDRSIIEMFDFISGGWDWPERSKILVMHADALTWEPPAYLGDIDTLLIDIWPKVGDTRLREETQRIQRNVQAKNVGAWGQELDVVTWAAANRCPMPPAPEHIQRFVEETGVPWIGRTDEDYGETCIQAGTQVVLALT